VDGLHGDAVLTTPAHQFPTGAVLSAERRRALLEWARRRGALVIEDDYDAEFRYDQASVRALQGLDPASGRLRRHRLEDPRARAAPRVGRPAEGHHGRGRTHQASP